ncbi:MAG: 50S ribosomal protein L10 [Spirochaetes bacterium GWD1_27_9]|nr:MAG: 50S ribosomal protein L10 [Spirochaetes bacterium GWB1_27_13]OHD21012.1 MAG: 50S ribosomal protein L10 [Spirochaetes bacterium GWC1_27_15]OHD45411.1 MAG: 50S ribosomal protein L10 [Spirochaetes bacterium GWD1_27_9]
MAQQYKIDKISELKKKYFDCNRNYVFTDFKGLSVEKISSIRKKLRNLDAKLVVIKNSYIKNIVKEKGIDDLKEIGVGPTAVVFANDTVTEVVKLLFESTKDSPLKIKGGYAEGSLFDAKAIEAFSKLPGKKELIAMVMATMNAPIQNFAYACNDVIGRFVRVVKAYEEKQQQAG